MKTILRTLFIMCTSLTSYFALAQCPSPTNLIATYNNNVSTFTWDAVPGAINYKFEIKFQWNPWTNAGVLTASNNSIILTGLFQSAPLDWRVSTNCGNGVYSTPTANTYIVPCPEPSNAIVSNITGTTATISWTAAPGYKTNVSDFVVSYRLANTNNAWISAGHTSVTSKILTGLLSSTAYEFCVNQSCMYFSSSPLLGTFTTAYIACNVPTFINVTNATSNQATVSWAAVNGGLNYTVEYKPANSTTWTTVTTSTNTPNIVLTGLSSATLYDVRVKANCTAGISTYIATQFTTYTSPCTSWGTNPYEYIDLFSFGTINRTSGIEVGGYFNTGLSTVLVRGSSTNAGQFSAGFSPGVSLGEDFAIYIDFNNNGSFSDAGEAVVVNTTSVISGGTYNFNIAIPNNVSTGSRKMRVVMCRSRTLNNTNTYPPIAPCTTGFYGEVEDYNVNIINGTNKSSGEPIAVTPADVVKRFSVYPNPSNGIFNIELPEKINATDYEILNNTGSVIVSKNITSVRSFSIDLSNQSSGLYILNVFSSDGNKRYTLKLNLVK